MIALSFKFKTMILSCVMVTGLFAGRALPAARAQGETAPRIHVLCSFFPVYQFTQNVAAGREGVRVELMLPAAMGCPHDTLLTPQDMEKVGRAQVFVANGLGLEEFLGAPLTHANPKLTIIDASRGITDLIVHRAPTEPASAGPAAPEAEANTHIGPNPHLFASPAMAARMVRNIAEGLAKVDPEGAAIYKKNATAYEAKLRRLSADFDAEARRLRTRKIVTEHSVFDYLARQIGLEVVAVIEENPGQEPSAAQMLDLVQTIKQSGAAAVFIEPQYPAAVARTIAREVGLPVAVLDPVASGPERAPLTYYESVMRKNIETLGQTLGEKK